MFKDYSSKHKFRVCLNIFKNKKEEIKKKRKETKTISNELKLWDFAFENLNNLILELIGLTKICILFGETLPYDQNTSDM